MKVQVACYKVPVHMPYSLHIITEVPANLSYHILDAARQLALNVVSPLDSAHTGWADHSNLCTCPGVIRLSILLCRLSAMCASKLLHADWKTAAAQLIRQLTEQLMACELQFRD